MKYAINRWTCRKCIMHVLYLDLVQTDKIIFWAILLHIYFSIFWEVILCGVVPTKRKKIAASYKQLHYLKMMTFLSYSFTQWIFPLARKFPVKFHYSPLKIIEKLPGMIWILHPPPLPLGSQTSNIHNLSTIHVFDIKYYENAERKTESKRRYFPNYLLVGLHRQIFLIIRRGHW